MLLFGEPCFFMALLQVRFFNLFHGLLCPTTQSLFCPNIPFPSSSCTAQSDPPAPSLFLTRDLIPPACLHIMSFNLGAIFVVSPGILYIFPISFFQTWRQHYCRVLQLGSYHCQNNISSHILFKYVNNTFTGGCFPVILFMCFSGDNLFANIMPKPFSSAPLLMNMHNAHFIVTF